MPADMTWMQGTPAPSRAEVPRRDPAITFERVGKRFNGRTVLADLDLDVSQGQVLGLIGASGVGKTTVLKLIAGLLLPDSGRISTAPGRLAYVFQEPRLLPWRSALDNVAVVLRAQGRGSEEARSEAGRWLEKLGLQGDERLLPAELSGGMAQRVSLARALAGDPEILLLDEPFSNLDAAVKADIARTLRTVVRRRGTTVVHVTHDLTEVLQWADRILELDPSHRHRELDLSDRRAAAEEWLARALDGFA
jgi:NitT/TauT family transport system ATP-binding protein